MVGGPGNTLKATYDTAGNFVASATIDDVPVGTLTVRVTGPAPSSAIGCWVGHTRVKYIAIEPEEAKLQIAVTFSGEAQMHLNGPYPVAGGVRVDLTALETGQAWMQFRLGTIYGPVIGTYEIHAFNLTYRTPDIAPVFQTYSDGDMLAGSAIRMEPHWPGHRIRLYILSSGALFEDTGTTEHIANTEDFNDHGEYVYYLTTPDNISHDMEVADEE